MGKGKNEQQMAIMFMKIDTNCDGTVDWVRERERERERRETETTTEYLKKIFAITR